jgi:hypothetical protein
MMSELTMTTPQALEKQQFSYISKNLVIIYILASVKRDWELKLSLVFRSQTSSTLIHSH